MQFCSRLRLLNENIIFLYNLINRDREREKKKREEKERERDRQKEKKMERKRHLLAFIFYLETSTFTIIHQKEKINNY